MVCCLCLKNRRNSKEFGVFSDEGVKLNVAGIISQHFWLQPDDEQQNICGHCWKTVRDFHAFYQAVAEAHKRLKPTDLVSIVMLADNALKPEEVDNGSAPGTGQLMDVLAESFFDSEVKVEVRDLDLLPSVEVMQDSIKKELTPNDVNVEQEFPLDILASVTSNKFDSTSDIDDDAHFEDMLSAPNDTDDLDDEVPLHKLRKTTRAVKKPVQPKVVKRRGRPPKLKEKVVRPKRSKTEAKTAAMASDVKLECGVDGKDTDAKAKSIAAAVVLGTDDSSSSSSESESDVSTLPDYEPLEQYAEIPKRVVNKPKKYRKREKPLVPPRRMTREEIDRRNAQQAEFDKVIAKFYDKFPCTVCNLYVQNFGDMKRHFRSAHNIDPGYIVCCGRRFHLRRALADHVLLHWNPEHFKCGTCGRVLQDSRTLEQHELTHTNPTEAKERRSFQCDQCPKTFTSKSALEHHSFSKHVPNSEFQFACTECDKKLPTARRLRDHMKQVHDPESAIICDKCGKQLRTQSNLKKHHELEHSDVPRPTPEPMQCGVCGAWLRHIAGLKQHIKTMHEEAGGEHRCHICNKTSTNARALKRHIYHNHLCERKFKCTMCEKAFKRPQDLREHTSTHTGEVLYTCPNCPMTFFSNANMYKHRQRLHRAAWEADRKKPGTPIMQQAVAATAATMKLQHQKATLFSCKTQSSTVQPIPQQQQQPF